MKRELQNLNRIAALFVATMCCDGARGQSINVDISIGGDPAIGGGVPSDSFAGVGQPGRWNFVDVIENATNLVDLQGNVRSVSVTTDGPSGSFGGGGFANQSNTGDFARLLNDAGFVNGAWRSWTFNGLTNGRYRVVTFAVHTSPEFSTALVSVSNSITPNPQVAQGIMPGNQLLLGVTHTVHEVDVVNGQLVITVSRNLGSPIACVNGFQLTAVPEPSSIVFLSAAATGLLARRRNRQLKAPG